jgi:hypothetical protein
MVKKKRLPVYGPHILVVYDDKGWWITTFEATDRHIPKNR